MKKILYHLYAIIFRKNIKRSFLIITIILFLVLFLLPLMHFSKPLAHILKTPIISLGTNISLSIYNILFGILASLMVYFLGNYAIKKTTIMLDEYGILKNNSGLIFNKVLRVMLYFLSALILLNIVGIPLTTVNILTGSVGFGLVFGLQKIASNFISGFIIAFEHSINQGDVLILYDGTWGVVKAIKGRYTLIQTYGGENYMIPNEQFITQPLVNLTSNNLQLRFDVRIGVAYGTDLELALSLLHQAAQKTKGCSMKNPPTAMIENFGNSSINLHMWAWTADLTQGYSSIRSEVYLKIWKLFQENQISIPFPQMDVHIQGQNNFLTSIKKTVKKNNQG